jgi:fibronectin-binding autotransporter adhesin
MKSLSALILTAILLFIAPTAQAEVWNLATGGTWNDTANWTPASIPNAVDANATFNNAASGSNPAQTANRAVTLDGATTVGSIAFNADAANAFTNTISTGTGGPLTFDVTAGNATITTNGTGTGNNTISVAMVLNDDLVATVNQQNTASAALSLNLTAAISGTGGFTKTGDGGATFGTGAKTYTGATNINGGRIRISLTARPSASSSVTVNGGQIDLISTGSYTFGSGPLNLNGAGPATGQFSAFPGVIRPDTGLVITITNPVVLQSTSTVHMQGSATGALTFTGAVSGVGGLVVTHSAHDANIGQIILNGSTNSYTGGTTVNAGALVAGATSINAFGTGNVSVVSAHAFFAGSQAKIMLQGGATNAIDDTATLSLAGGNAGGVADDGFIDLSNGINETVGGLILGGVAQTLSGTYGSTASGAAHPFDEYFAGLGLITLAAPAGVPGDYNNNGVVDAADYVIWRKNSGTNMQLQNEVAGTTPGQVTQEDYNAWRARFANAAGSGSALSAPTAVPEPATFVIAAFLSGTTVFARFRRL